MSRKHHDTRCCQFRQPAIVEVEGKGGCCCNFNTLIILILIILQFSKKEHGKHNQIDNSILFIIALFFLSCCNPCKK
jgi:hypothetical protein